MNMIHIIFSLLKIKRCYFIFSLKKKKKKAKKFRLDLTNTLIIQHIKKNAILGSNNEAYNRQKSLRTQKDTNNHISNVCAAPHHGFLNLAPSRVFMMNKHWQLFCICKGSPAAVEIPPWSNELSLQPSWTFTEDCLAQCSKTIIVKQTTGTLPLQISCIALVSTFFRKTEKFTNEHLSILQSHTEIKTVTLNKLLINSNYKM